MRIGRMFFFGKETKKKNEKTKLKKKFIIRKEDFRCVISKKIMNIFWRRSMI
jgi:hypothetical protein